MGQEGMAAPWSTVEVAHRLDWAIFKYGRKRGKVGGDLWGVSHQGKWGVRAVNPFSVSMFATEVHRAIECHLADGEALEQPRSLRMVTVLDLDWHIPWNAEGFDHQAILSQTRRRLRGLDYVLFLELGPLSHLGNRCWAPHFHGFFFNVPSPRKLKPFRELFSGGVGGAPAMRLSRVTDLGGACRYCVKIPSMMNSSYRPRDGRFMHRSRKLSLPEHFRYWESMRGLECTDLAIAGGKGRKVLKRANRALDRSVALLGANARRR